MKTHRVTPSHPGNRLTIYWRFSIIFIFMESPDWQIDNFKQMNFLRWMWGLSAIIIAGILIYGGFENTEISVIVAMGFSFGMGSFAIFKPKLIRVKLEKDELKIFMEDLFNGKAKSKIIALQSVQSIKSKNLNDPCRVEATIENRTENDFIEDIVLPIKFLSVRKREALVDKLRDLKADPS